MTPDRVPPANANRPFSLFLDVDGTLLDFADHPDAVLVSPALIDLLQGLETLCSGALALVSGRSIVALDRLFAPYRGAAVGIHGAELRHNNHPDTPPPNAPPLPAALRAALLAAAAPHAPTCIEDKGSALAVHHRLAAPAMQSLRRALRAACSHAGNEWAVLRGRQVLEVKPRAISKARGVASLLALRPFAGTTPIAFGDDLTDLDMFQAVQAQGGLRVAVGPRITQRADLHLATPAHTRAALGTLRAQLTRGARTAQAWSLLHEAAQAP